MLRSKKRISALLSGVMFLSLLFPAGQAAASDQAAAATSVIDMRQMEIGPGATYTWANMQKGSGEQKVHMVEFNPTQGNLELQPGLTDGKVYGMQGVSKMASDADKAGNRVIAAVNGDFYDMSTGIPLGLFMGDGELLTDPPSGRNAFGIKQDGTSLYGSPKLTKNVTIGGTVSSLSSINRLRGTDALVLYTEKFNATTMTNNLGDEVILDIVSGRAASGETLRMKVASVLKDQGNSPIGQGQVVLSASGSQRNKLAGLKAGDEVTASFQLDNEWRDVTMAIGGTVMLVKDGVVQQHTDPAVHPRTVVGTKADGSVVLFEVDGRQPGFSEGLTYIELGEMLQELGVVNALNLDGGGSATFVARLPGETERKVLNSPSDGGERKTANGILLVNKAPEGAANKLVVAPTLERVLTGSSATFKTAAVDQNLHPANMTEAAVWSVDPAYGTIDATGTFKAGNQPGLTEVSVQSGNLTGKAALEVVDELTELRFSDAVKTFSSGSTETLKVTALRNGQVVQADNSRLEWRTEGDIGTIDGNGTFTATDKQDVSGKIFVKYGQIETSIEVNVGLPPVMLEDFENGLSRYKPSAGAQFKSTKVSIETDETYIRSGNGALKLEYDFTGMTGTSGAYLQTNGTTDNIEIPGYPEKISMWVYGDGNAHWLRAQLRDSKGAIPLDFTDQTTGVDFKGWKYLEASVPKGRTLPLVMDMPVRYMETQAAKKDAGAIYVDEIRALYGPANDDIDPPVLKKFSPADGAEITENTPTITVYAEDAGYDPVAHPGTTLIDPDKIRFYLDGSLVQHTLYPPEGRIHYTPNVPLADGVHQAKVTVRDLSGNQTTHEWNFTVNTGAAKVVYNTPDTIYVGGSYTLDIGGVKTSQIRSGHVDFQFDPAKVENLELIPGDKLSASQVSASIDGSTGKVGVTWKDIHTASLQDTDWIGQIRYDVKKNATGSSIISLTSGAVSFIDTGNTEFSFYGLPMESQIATHYALRWNEEGTVQGYETEFKVTDAQGQPVEGVQILADAAAVGITDAAGILKTGSLTSQVKTYTVQAVKGNQYSPALEFKVSPLAGSPTPFNISVGMGEDPTTSRMLNWHTDPATEGTVVELAKRSEFTDFDAPNVQKFNGASELYHTLDLGTVRVHKATAAGLEPGTEYVYRVGDGQGHYSAQGSFKTTELAGDTTKFLYFADSQASTAKEFELWGNTIDKAAAEHPDAEFMVHAGDMVDKGFLEEQWNYWFNEAQKHFLNTTLVSAIGNHEVMGTKENGDFLAHFNQPGNGLDSLKGTNFSFDYKDVHFIMLNSEYQLEEQKKWLQQDLANNTKKWTVAMFHRGPYGSIYDSAEVRSLWAPLLEEFGVDLVLNGHDHIYIRSYPMMDNQIAADSEGTTYVVAGSSGPKFYSHTERGWHEVVDEEKTQMYASVEVKGDALHFVTKTVGGRVVDEFTLTKPNPEQIVVKSDELTLAAGESHELQAAVKPSRAERTVVWSVYHSEPSDHVVSVSEDGIVTAQGLGHAVVRATSTVASDVYTDVSVTVDRIPNGSIESIRLSGKSELKIGDTDKTVTEAVYTDGSRIRLIEGVTYASSKPDVASIDVQGSVRALAEGATVISATYEGLKSEYALRVIARGGGNPDPWPEPPVDPPVQPPVTPPSGSITLSASELAAKLSNGQVILSVEGNFTDITLPGNAADILKDGSVRLEAKNLSLTIPAEVLRQLGGLANAGQLEKGAIKLSAATLSDAEMKERIAQAARVSGAKLTAAGAMLEFQLQLTTADGKVHSLTEFDHSITLELPVSSDANGKRISMYYLSGNGELEYIGGVNKDGRVAAGIRHFSAYGLLDYEKTFADVPSSFWAAEVIGDLAAKQLIEGVSADRFVPAQQVTRAEFAAMLVRLLDLKAEGPAPFDDVPSGKWYVEAVSAAAQSGIVNGTGKDRFAPDAPIKRQEMAAMLVRAYAHAMKLQQESISAGSGFTDLAESPDWVQEAVETAFALGFVQGHTPSRFEPDGLTTRAESAQVIYNLLNKLK
ncbi:phosphodiester glycosidase family protein [Paenibacillus sp. MDMC362]|uniref:phosphodiester glycosidase family protein n=1 Tax=Paenibacillus sp. MDMC362 TaxID=2977365 RepID=UPI000DC4B273|nr:phosphodiester glycosidase family protein [Paenibacillus sp. MDMC362]RAR43688.1 metallophosphoesterase [Paenibacillus sp. MDMC362]